MEQTTNLRAGTAATDITPPIGTALCGGLHPRESVGLDTPLSAKAVVFDRGDTAVAIVSVDLCVLGKGFVDRATALIEARTGIPADHVMVAASHTHAGPYTEPLFSSDADCNAAYLALLPHYIADAATTAYARLTPAQVGACSGREDTSGHYRRVGLKNGHVRNTWIKPYPDEAVGPLGEIDPEVGVMLTQTAAGDTLSVVFNYSLHANCHDKRNHIDASYPVRVARRVESAIGGMTSYTPGACGNINPSGTVDGIADALADEVLRVIPGIQTRSDVGLHAHKAQIELPLRDFSRARVEAMQRDWPGAEDVFTEEWRRLHEAGDSTVGTSVQVLAIGDTAFVGTPGELFVELGRAIKEASPFPHTYVVELANDYVGYIPTRAAFDEGGYEVLDARSSKVGPGAGEIVVAECVKLLNDAAGPRAGGAA